MDQTSPVLGPNKKFLFLIHLKILGEIGLPREDPGPSPGPPLLDGGAGFAAHGGERSGGGGGGDGGGGLEVERERGESSPETGLLVIGDGGGG